MYKEYFRNIGLWYHISNRWILKIQKPLEHYRWSMRNKKHFKVKLRVKGETESRAHEDSSLSLKITLIHNFDSKDDLK